jgi:o-succinylbenzoate synthase
VKLGRLTTSPLRLPLRRPFITASGALTAREGVLVFAEAEGVVGVGEAMPLPFAGTETLAQCVQALEPVQQLEGRALDIEALLAALPALEGAPAARFAVETALLDLVARTRGCPLSALLAERPVRSVEVNAVIDASADAPAQAAAQRDEGFRVFKLKLTSTAAGLAAAVREVIGAQAELRLDANASWSLAQATQALSGLQSLRPAYCEDPLANIDDVPALRRATSVRIAADSWLATATGRARVLSDGLADVCILKPAVLGGLGRALAFAARARAHGMSVVVTTTLEGVVARLAALHLAAALGEDTAHGLATAHWLERDWAVDPAPIIQGRINVPPGPGLGLDLIKKREAAA